MRHLKGLKRNYESEKFWRKRLEDYSTDKSSGVLVACYKYKNYSIVNDLYTDETGTYNHISLSASDDKLKEKDIEFILKSIFGDAPNLEKIYSNNFGKPVLNVYDNDAIQCN